MLSVVLTGAALGQFVHERAGRVSVEVFHACHVIERLAQCFVPSPQIGYLVVESPTDRYADANDETSQQYGKGN